MTGRRPEDGAITIGQVVGPFGIRGGVKVKVLTDFLERFDAGRSVWINGRTFTIKETQWHKGQARLMLSEVTDRNEAESMQWCEVTVPADDGPELQDDEFLTADLIGLKVVTSDGRDLGKVTDVFPTPAHDVIEVGKILIPAVREFVLDIDLDGGTMTVELIDGMED